MGSRLDVIREDRRVRAIEARKLIAEGMTVVDVAKCLEVSRNSIYLALKAHKHDPLLD